MMKLLKHIGCLFLFLFLMSCQSYNPNSDEDDTRKVIRKRRTIIENDNVGKQQNINSNIISRNEMIKNDAYWK